MIDINKIRNNFEKFPSLKQKCGDHAAVLVQQQQKRQHINSNFNSNKNAHKITAAATATAPKTAAVKTLKTTIAATKPTTTNTSVVNGKSEATRRSPIAVGRRATSASSRRNTKAANNSSNTTNNNINNDTNPVRTANKPFFLVPQFQDQNFLKEECELAHAQVAIPGAEKRQSKSAGVSINGHVGELNNNNNIISNATNLKSSSNGCRNSCDGGKGNNNNKTSHSYAINGIIGGNRRPTTAPHPSAATVAAVTANGMRRSGGGSANASVNISQHHHHQHISSAAAAATTPATTTAAAAVAETQNGASTKSATTDSSVHKVDIVFNNRLPSQQTNGGRIVVASKSPKQPQQHMFNCSRPLTGTTTNATKTIGTPTSTSVSGGASTSTVVTTKVTNGPIKLVRPLVHRSIPSTAVASANATATRDNVNAYSNKLFNSYGSNSSRFSNNNNNNNNSASVVGNVISGGNSGGCNNNISSNKTDGSSGASAIGVNGMQHTLDHDDIKYIDSDDAPTTLAQAPTAAAAAAVPTTSSSGGGAQLERKTQLRCEQVCCQHTNSATPASAGGGSGGGDSAPFKTRMRPKSTIICSTSNLVFEKINNYKYANGSASGGGSSAAKFAAEAAAARRHELRHSIDSNSIRASIQKFDSFSEQKRSGVTQVTLRPHGGSGSTSNLQHHRHSGSEFDHATGSSSLLRMAQSGGGSLTRAPYRTASPSPATACKVTATMHGTTLAACSTGSSSSSIRTMSSSSATSSTNSLPTKSAGSIVAASTTAAAISANRHPEVSLLRTSGSAAHTAFLQNKDVAGVVSKKVETKMMNGDVKKCAKAETNGLCNGAAGDVDSIRSTALRSIPPAPPSPTASRYWDRDSRTITSSALSSSPSSATNNIDDVSKSKTSDENSEGLCGLRNIGNTCFMNSVIQCLSHTSELTKFLRTYNGTRSTSSKDQQILQEFAKLIREMWTSNVHSVTPMDLKRAFSLKHRMYSDYNQQDAQEFLRFFLDSLHCALNTGVKGEHLKIDDNLSDNKKADLTWEWYARHENSLIRDLFVGQLKSALRCTSCGNTSVTFDPFWDLSVSLPSLSRCKLESCLDLFIREEVLDGDEMPTCAKCRQRRRCTKSFTIQRFPKYLVIHLKRFSETRWSKLSNIVEFPTGERELNMGPYGSNPNTNIYYSLYAISNHMGSTAGGHYVALCKHPVSRKWHEFNDNIVSDTLSESNLVSSSAYILFYERV
ncbi:ubiquitin carboxyl-terminal hydrolase Usp2 isoform X1 [Rhagoletis pomonella]|uniref:ubiquitin carboxyl-terminal hydrolase Usp2 isoform X1 n=1 Tax=Rhagoletis pomonella TaxID=28610 RepID=UPI001785CA8D|nr:ubiquitin carboxyl-terminal hydrolase Usp2 isoform X1 [Rhagoletis pomonella]